MPDTALRTLIQRWREDPGGAYHTWFLWEERLKNFRSIRRGLQEVVAEIEGGTFGNVYNGSSLQTVVGSIAERRQIFKGADHAFLPFLRIEIAEEKACLLIVITHGLIAVRPASSVGPLHASFSSGLLG